MHFATTAETKEVSAESRLSKPHLRELHEGSGIPLEMIAEDGGIWTVSTRAELPSLGYTESWHEQLVPAIGFRVRPPDGSNSLYVLKPDHPRERKDKRGKFIKYEWPHGQPHRLDVVGDLADLADPTVDVYVVEGKKKALKILAHKRARGERCVVICLWGVWAWGKKPDDNARCALIPDWDLVVLDGRRVFIVFDSDRDDKPEVELAARQLSDRLGDRGAWVYHVKLFSEPDGSKNGADDLMVRHSDEAFAQLVEEALERGPHGTEALRAQLRQLRQQISAEARVLCNKNLRPTEKVVALVAIREAGWRHSKGAETPFTVNQGRLAEAAGLKSRQSVSRSLDVLAGPGGLFEKRTTREYSEEVGWHSATKLTPRHDGGSVALLEAAASVKPVRIDKDGHEKGSWGGYRPRCPDHPRADVIERTTVTYVCTECGQVVHQDEPTIHVLKSQVVTSDAEQLNDDEASTSADPLMLQDVTSADGDQPDPAKDGLPSQVVTSTGPGSVDDSVLSHPGTYATLAVTSAVQPPTAGWDEAKAEAMLDEALGWMRRNCPASEFDRLESELADDERFRDAYETRDLEALHLALHAYLGCVRDAIQSWRERMEACA